MSIESEYNGDILSADQIELLHAGLVADLAEMAEADASEPEIEAEI